MHGWAILMSRSICSHTIPVSKSKTVVSGLSSLVYPSILDFCLVSQSNFFETITPARHIGILHPCWWITILAHENHLNQCLHTQCLHTQCLHTLAWGDCGARHWQSQSNGWMDGHADVSMYIHMYIGRKTGGLTGGHRH